MAELTTVHDGQRDERQGHAEEIEEKRGGVLERILDKDEGRAPDEDDRQQENVGDRAGA